MATRRTSVSAKRKQAAARIGKKVKPLGEVTDLAKVLVFSKNKVGKTTFAASAPNVLLIDINEEGTRSVRHVDGHYLPVRQWEEVDAAYWWLKAHLKEFESVAIDTTTAMTALAMRFSLGESEVRDPHKPINMPVQKDWNRVTELVRPQILAFRNLPLHVVFTAQERRETDQDTGELLSIVPDLPAGVRGTAMGAVGVVGHLSKRKPKRKAERAKKWPRVLLVGDHEVIASGNRVDALPRQLRNPTMPDIIAAYRD